MPTSPISPSALVNYMGFAKQGSKGTGVTPVYFAAYMDPPDATPGHVVRRIREAGNGLYIARDVKDLYRPTFRFGMAARPSITAALIAYFLGADAITGAGDPYTHTLTPSEATTWISVEQNLNDEVIERFVDGFLTELVIDIRKRDAGPETMLIASGQSLSVAYQASPGTDTYETARPWLRSDATWELDNAAVTDVESTRITLRWLFDESILADAITRSNAVKLGFEADVETVQLFTSTAALEAYRGTHYGATGGTAESETVWQPQTTDSFKVKLDYDAAGPLERSVELKIPQIAWEQATLSPLNPAASEAVRLTRTGHLIYSATPITVTCLNSGAVDLV